MYLLILICIYICVCHTYVYIYIYIYIHIYIYMCVCVHTHTCMHTRPAKLREMVSVNSSTPASTLISLVWIVIMVSEWIDWLMSHSVKGEVETSRKNVAGSKTSSYMYAMLLGRSKRLPSETLPRYSMNASGDRISARLSRSSWKSAGELNDFMSPNWMGPCFSSILASVPLCRCQRPIMLTRNPYHLESKVNSHMTMPNICGLKKSRRTITPVEATKSLKHMRANDWQSKRRQTTAKSEMYVWGAAFAGICEQYKFSCLNQHTDISNLKRFEQIELQAKLLNYFLGSNKSNINQSLSSTLRVLLCCIDPRVRKIRVLLV